MTSLIYNDQYASIEGTKTVSSELCYRYVFNLGLKSGSQAVGASVWSGIKGVVTMRVNDYGRKGVKGLLTVLLYF